MSERPEQEQVRIDKLRELRTRGFNFPNDVRVTATSAVVAEAEVAEPAAAKRFTLAGRLVQVRVMGKAAFAHILDGAGKAQIYVRRDDIGADAYADFKHLDIGDIIEVSGFVFVTKTGEKTIHCETLRLLTKALIPLPEKWHGLADVEARYRQRYVDLIANPDVRQVFRTRAKVIQSIRNFLDERGFIEVETPVLNHIASGATARPFLTHFNALHSDMALRIALELPLKKLVVGGFERVYEIGRNFRNEGLSTKHNPEFTMLEFYQAYASFEELMDLSEELVTGIVRKISPSLRLPFGDKEIDFTPPWPRISMRDSIHEIGGVPRTINIDVLEDLHKVATQHDIFLSDKNDWGRCFDNLWEHLVEPKLVNPTFITHHPFSISPLARKNSADPRVVDRFEFIIAGMEMGNAFSELNDAEDQRERFEAQAARRAQGDLESPEVDEDFLRALEYGMPPTAGEGIGIDRLVMLLTNSTSIRDVLLFPQMKVRVSAEEPEVE